MYEIYGILVTPTDISDMPQKKNEGKKKKIYIYAGVEKGKINPPR